MCKRMAFILLAAVTLAAVAGSASLGQSTVPDAYVKGSGAIKVGSTNIGMLDVNVAQSGNVLTGGFRYTEVASNAAPPTNIIVSRVLKSLVVQGNFATIKAEGYWNRGIASLTLEVRDLNPLMDWIHIHADLIDSPLPVCYDASGVLIKGDIVVFSKPAPGGYTKGFGTIATINSCIGRFRFVAELTSAGVRGWIQYVDYNPLAMSPIVRPRAVIYVPAVQSLTITGKVAVLTGKGTLNGRPAFVEVRAIDNTSPSGPALRDEFYIKAIPLTTDSVSAIYQAGGPLTSGDIVVAPIDGG